MEETSKAVGISQDFFKDKSARLNTRFVGVKLYGNLSWKETGGLVADVTS